MVTLRIPNAGLRPRILKGIDVTTPLTGPGGLATRLAPWIKAVADEIEDLYNLPATLVTELRDAGAFSLLTPRDLGGFEAPLTTVLTVYPARRRARPSESLTSGSSSTTSSRPLMPAFIHA